MKLQDIHPNPKNPRFLRKEKSEWLEDSLNEFGDLSGYVFNKGGMIISAHQRWEKIKPKVKEVVIRETFKKPLPDGTIERGHFELNDGTKHDYSVRDWTPEKADRATIRANAQNAGEWDADVLANQWEYEPEVLQDMGVPEWVFGEDRDDEDAVKLEAKEDEYEPPAEIITDIVTGDLFEIGRHRLLCGDSTSADDVARLMNGEKAEILFTSPPYVEMRKYNGGKDLSLDKLIKFIPAWSAVCEYLCINLGLQFKDSEVVAYWDDYLIEAKEAGLKLVAWNVWDKTMGGTIASATNMFLLTHEWIFVFGTQRKRLNRTIPNQADKYEARHGKDWQKGIDKHFRNEEDAMEATTSATYSHHQLHSVVQQTPELGNIRSLHPATFPVGLPAKYIEAMTDEKQIVAESFTGSGTTMVAAHQLNRRCFGIEIDAKYCQVIVDRMLKLDPTLEIKRNGQPYQK